MKLTSLLTLILAATTVPSYAATINCVTNAPIVTNGVALSAFTVGCAPYIPGNGLAVEQFSLTAIIAYQTTAPSGGTLNVALTPQGIQGSLIPPATPSIVVTGTTGSLQATSPASLTLAVADLNGISINVAPSGTGGLPDNAVITLRLTTVDTPIGSSQNNPSLPNSGGNGTWTFINGPTGAWFDPPFVDAFDYVGIGGTLFNSITLPTGFTAPFDVYNGSTFIGSFAGGSAVNFVALAGGALSSFRVANITPLADAGSATAFPLQIFFSTPTGSFTQTGVPAVPEPSTSLALVTLLAWGWRRSRRS